MGQRKVKDPTIYSAIKVTGNVTLDGAQLPGFESSNGSGLSSGDALIQAPSAGVVSELEMREVRHAQFTLTSKLLTILAANDYGSIIIGSLPDTNLMILGAETNLTFVRGGGAAATNVSLSIGHSQTNDTTLSGDEVSVMPEFDVALTSAWQQHSYANGFTPTVVPDNSLGQLLLNAVSLVSTEGQLTFSGTIDIYYADLGNVTS